jgi:hypothetical protein
LSRVLERLLSEDFTMWDQLVFSYEQRNKQLRVPMENTTETLHDFNVRINELYTEAHYDFTRARHNRDAIQRFIENVLKDYYTGPNELARKAGGIQFARNYPAPDFWPEDTVDLFEVEDRLLHYYNQMDSTIKTLEAKADSKITNNSLLRIESKIV